MGTEEETLGQKFPGNFLGNFKKLEIGKSAILLGKTYKTQRKLFNRFPISFLHPPIGGGNWKLLVWKHRL